MPTVFECKMCGHCCEGKGGIILSPFDLERASAFVGLTQEEFLAQNVEKRNGKNCIKTGPDGYCIFFVQGKGCSIHPGKPDVCRTWPFFRGNLVDHVSLELAKEYCPGIRSNASFIEFQTEGRAYIQKHGLQAPNNAAAPNALKA